MTQAAQLTQALRRGWHTWGDLQALRISTCPWARLISEGGLERNLVAHETLARRIRDDGIVEMKIIRATKWTA